LPLVFSVLWPVSLLCSFMIAFGFLCTEARVSALFIHDFLWFSLYCGQCLYFVHSWLPLVFSNVYVNEMMSALY
jgi:hypothetical protein